MVNQRPFYEHRSVLPVHSPPCAVLDKVECDLCQYLSGEEKYSQLFECFGRDATSVHCFLNAEGLQNCKKMLQMAKAGKYNGYLLEGMACPGGCVAGAGTLQVVKKAAAALEKMKGEASFTESSDSKYQSRLESLEKFDVE